MNGRQPRIAPNATHAEAVTISQRPIGCGACWMKKYATASSSASPSRNGHLGTVQCFESFTLAVSEKRPASARDIAQINYLRVSQNPIIEIIIVKPAIGNP